MPNPEDIINNSEDVRESERALAVSMRTEGTDVSAVCGGLKVSG